MLAISKPLELYIPQSGKKIRNHEQKVHLQWTEINYGTQVQTTIKRSILYVLTCLHKYLMPPHPPLYHASQDKLLRLAVDCNKVMLACAFH